MKAVEAFWNAAMPKLLDFGKAIVLALVLWLVGKWLIKYIVKLFDRILEHGKVEKSVHGFLVSLVRVILKVLLILVIASTIGIETSSVLAMVGSIGLTIGLALQGSLSNFAGGVLILILKPFVVGDYIVAEGMEGTVTAVDIFYTKLLTTDNRVVILPNGALANSNVVNVSKEAIRRVDLTASVAYDSNLADVKKMLFELAAASKFLLDDAEHPIQVYVDQYADSAIILGLRFWVKKENYWDAKWEVTENMKQVFDANGVSIPFNQLDVLIKNNESKM